VWIFFLDSLFCSTCIYNLNVFIDIYASLNEKLG
jgi:hypothetical protein